MKPEKSHKNFGFRTTKPNEFWPRTVVMPLNAGQGEQYQVWRQWFSGDFVLKLIDEGQLRHRTEKWIHQIPVFSNKSTRRYAWKANNMSQPVGKNDHVAWNSHIINRISDSFSSMTSSYLFSNTLRRSRKLTIPDSVMLAFVWLRPHLEFPVLPEGISTLYRLCLLNPKVKKCEKNRKILE